MNLNHIPILDHHAHPLLRPEATATAVAFQRWFTESTDPVMHQQHVPQALFFRTAIRWLAELLGCEATLTAVLASRAAIPYAAWTRRLFSDANISHLLCDYGYTSPEGYDHAAMQALLPCPVQPILRLETYFQDLILAHDTFAQAEEAYVATLRQARAQGYVALKSIIAYRVGLGVEPANRQAAQAAFGPLKEAGQRNGRLRLAQPDLCHHLLWLAAEAAAAQQLPLQIHTGFGDRDADLRWANPLHLRTFIEQTSAPLVLLHAGWPFWRETAHLAALYSHVWLDLSLAVPLATAGIPGMLRDVLGLAPHSKILFASDAFTMPEIFWLAARWGRWGLGKVLAEFVEEGFMTSAEAETTAVAILHRNAATLYPLTP